MNNRTPQATVRELDKYIVGQREAKRAVAVALRNRERRRKLSPELRQEVMPKNILMIGPTGVGKTEVARRLASLINAPFVKVEATKFTEVGYVGKDVDSIAHELAESSVNMAYQEKLKEVESKAERLATERIVNYLCQQWAQKGKRLAAKSQQTVSGVSRTAGGVPKGARLGASIRRQVAELLRTNQLEEQFIEIEVGGTRGGLNPPGELSWVSEPDEIDISFNEVGDDLRKFGERRWRKVQVKEARRILTREEAHKMLDFDQLVDEALEKAEEDGVVFIDEIDKLIGPKVELGRDVSGEGVQRDLLPIVEGTTVMTRYGLLKTDHILFIAAGTFSHGKPSDLIPELQGRFPLRVELNPLSQQDLEKILVEPENALTRQYEALLATEGINLVFPEGGIREIARVAVLMNERTENIGARRLQTIMEKVLEELSFTAPEREGETVVIDASYVSQYIEGLIKDENLSKYIL